MSSLRFEWQKQQGKLNGGGDVFVWENPLHQGSPKHITSTETPDEQVDIDYDAPSMVNETSASKTITPIRVIHNSVDSKPVDTAQQKIVINLACENGVYRYCNIENYDNCPNYRH